MTALVGAATGSETAHYEYGPFGEPIRASGLWAKLNPFRFSTKYQDDETSLLYYGYRYYDSVTGRWLSRDPLKEDGGVSLYGFTDNNPETAIDIDGLSMWQDIKDTATGIGLYVSQALQSHNRCHWNSL